jgi:uncharacterized protein
MSDPGRKADGACADKVQSRAQGRAARDHAPMSQGGRVEPVTPTTPRPLRVPLLRQQWLDLALLHWEVPVEAAARFMPEGTRPDTFEGRTYVGLVPFRMVGTGFGLGPVLPYVGTFLETNVRLYSVDGQGRRGVVFRSLDADRLAVVLTAQAVLGLPYRWARMRYSRRGAGAGRAGDVVEYTARRRGAAAPASHVTIEIGQQLAEPSPLEQWLTARWGLHRSRLGRLGYLPNEHPGWSLHAAEALVVDDGLVAAAGFPRVTQRPPDSVLWSPGVPAAFGLSQSG